MDIESLEIFTDGSFCPNTGCSGYGICLDVDRSSVDRFQGRFPLTVRNSITAELIAVCHGVLLAHQELGLDNFKSITVVTDAPGVREAFKRVQRKNRELYRLAQMAKQLMDLYEIKIRTIKGHQPKHDSRDAYLNHRCDVLAKREMRQWRDSEFPLVIDGITSRRRERRVARAQEKVNLRKQVPSLW